MVQSSAPTKRTSYDHIIAFSLKTNAFSETAKSNPGGLTVVESHLAALQVPPHGSFATDGQTTVVEHAQEKQHQAENQASGDAQGYACDLTTVENVYEK